MPNTNRTPAQHRVVTEQQRAKQGAREPRQHKAEESPVRARLISEGCPHMAKSLNDWARLQELPQMCVANDNAIENQDGSDDDAAPMAWRFDNIMTTQSARRTIKLHKEGKRWRPGDERFDTPRRNNRKNSAPPAGSYRYNGIDLPLLPDAAGEAKRRIDATNARIRLGHVCARLLDLASGNSTRAEIAAAVKQPDGANIDKYVDHAIIGWMRDPVFQEYKTAA